MRRRLAAAATAVPIAVAGLLASHNAAYTWTTSDAHERGHVLAATGHGYLELVQPVLLALAGLMLLGALCARMRGSAPAISPQLLAVLPPVAFLLAEFLERLHQHGAVPAHLLAEPAVLVGLLLQAPFALAGYLVARILLGVAGHIGAALRAAVDGMCAPRRPTGARLPHGRVVPPPAPATGRAASRGPPAPALRAA